MNEHVLDELEAYALGALDRSDAERVAQHLEICVSCREDAVALAEVVGTLPDTVTPLRPRPALRDRILAAAATEQARAASEAQRRWSFGAVRPTRLVFAGLLASVIVLGAADIDRYQRLSAAMAERDQLYGLMENLRQGSREWYMAGKDSFAGAGGTLYAPHAAGKQPFVLFHDLPPVPAGKYLTVWLISPDSTWARAATFQPNGQDLQAVGINMQVAGFGRCAVTVEDSSWGPRYGAVVMESRIAPPAP